MNTRLNQLLVATAFAGGISAALPVHAAGGRSNDAALAAQVEDALLQCGQFRDDETNIVVTARQGTIKLSGWVVYSSDIKAAEKLASKISGVKAVTENLRAWSRDERP